MWTHPPGDTGTRIDGLPVLALRRGHVRDPGAGPTHPAQTRPVRLRRVCVFRGSLRPKLPIRVWLRCAPPVLSGCVRCIELHSRASPGPGRLAGPGSDGATTTDRVGAGPRGLLARPQPGGKSDPVSNTVSVPRICFVPVCPGGDTRGKSAPEQMCPVCPSSTGLEPSGKFTEQPKLWRDL